MPIMIGKTKLLFSEVWEGLAERYCERRMGIGEMSGYEKRTGIEENERPRCKQRGISQRKISFLTPQAAGY